MCQLLHEPPLCNRPALPELRIAVGMQVSLHIQRPPPSAPNPRHRLRPAAYRRQGPALRLLLLLYGYCMPVLTSVSVMDAFTPAPSKVRHAIHWLEWPCAVAFVRSVVQHRQVPTCLPGW